MSMTHDAELVQLESQTEILDGLQLFTRFHSNVIYVEGEQGSGKSWLAQRFLYTDKEIQTLSFLICLPSQTVDQQRSVLMSQLLSDSFCIGDESLVQSLEAYRKNQKCNATLIVDDAELLAPNLLHELCELVLAAQNNPLWQINVILFATPNSIDDDLKKEMPKPDIKSLVIQPLTDEEAYFFLDQLVIRHISTDKERDAIYQAASKIENWPADLLALISHQKHHASPWVRAILCTLIVLLISLGGWSWWASYQARIQDELLDSTVMQESLVQADNANRNLPEDISGAVSVISAGGKLQQGNNDASNFPQEVTSETLTVGDSSSTDQKRIIVPSNVVDALLDGNKPENVGASLKNTKPSASGNQESASENQASAPEHQEKVSASSLVLAYDELMAISETRYTLQLGAVETKSEALRFIQTYHLQDQVRVYRIIRNQKPWYIITYQDFATIKESREAAQELPIKLQKALPWPKSMAQVHQEIERAQ